MKTMVIVAHPDLSHSRVNLGLIQALDGHNDLTIRDLYEAYPDWNINADHERSLLTAHDRIVFQFPFYWYSSPPLLKKWFDDVFTSGWAYGPGGEHLNGKEFMVATTAGGTKNAYRAGGADEFTISELLRPIQRTVTKCSGIFLPPFVVYGVSSAEDDDLEKEGLRYAEHIQTPSRVLVH
ncbi:general stress protein [Paenibacillus sp. HJL G12]|uniref:General stress protein n=1 Tax=Paenibacillus dendrobii TaxID=2691084 RepID=A0A7X3IL08_9BACL|nr:NAD(P)H-dependent oxidoreductase [Paenibacillus dendrobii]MWV45580.1 general stress protein [Paenibacillus dendrobii]